VVHLEERCPRRYGPHIIDESHRRIALSPAIVGLGILIVAVLAIAWSWWQSQRETKEMQEMDGEFARQAAAAGAAVEQKLQPADHAITTGAPH
jgi:hypothetical protein